jgi:regulator of protease activity HflC (stomatin/prohibitin superfamily)
VLGVIIGIVLRVAGIVLAPRVKMFTPQIKTIFLFGFVGLCIGTAIRLPVIVPAGNVGVQDLWGSVSTGTYTAGLNFRNPLAKVHNFSIQTQELKETMSTPSKEGLITELEVSVWYKISPDKAPQIYREIGKDYRGTILEPLVRSVIRTVTAEHEAKDLYTAGRETIVAEIQKLVEPVAYSKGILIDSVLLRSVQLPQLVTGAIEQKLQAEQQAEQMKFVLQKETQEAERKRIEAQGIADFQKTVVQGITPGLLEWKGIEATEKIAASDNTKIVVIGNAKNGLPLILGGGDK